MRLKIALPRGWSEHDNPGGPLTYYRTSSVTSGALQISCAEYTGGELPNPSGEKLQRMAEEFGEECKSGELLESSNSPCAFGLLGTAIFHSVQHPRIQNWFLSNGKDFIMVTHICTTPPEPTEVREAQEIVRTLVLRKRPNWKFW
jgi:hypothetical protein